MLDPMGAKTSMTQQVFRQRSPLGLAAVCGFTGVILLLSLARNWADYPRPLFLSWVLLGLALAWSIFVRPAVLTDADGVTVRNVLRDAHIPWARLTHVETRWNLKVFAGDRGYTAWAISSQMERPKRTSGAMFGALSSRQSETATDRSASAPRVTASTVARSIEQAKREYDEAVAAGQLTAAPDERVRVRWVPLVAVVLLLPAIAMVALSVA
jgi:hypothetical protein